MTNHSAYCLYDCKSRREMRTRHGTPEEFAAAVSKAIGEISVDEALLAIQRYRLEYADAPHCCQACGEPVLECMGSTLASEICLALDHRIEWWQVGQVCNRCAMIGLVLIAVGKPLEQCTLEDYARLRGITPLE